MSKAKKRAARRKVRVGDMFVTHIARLVMIDGSTQFGWCVTDRIEPPEGDVEIFGPYPTVAAAQADADAYIRQQLGPQCEVRECGQRDPNWNKLQ